VSQHETQPGIPDGANHFEVRTATREPENDISATIAYTFSQHVRQAVTHADRTLFDNGSASCDCPTDAADRAMMTCEQGGVMAEVKQGRWTAEIDGDFVVFIIGARVNSKWQAVKSVGDLGGKRGMNHMLKYLTDHPEKGLLGYQRLGFANVQYWRTFEHLEAFAKDKDDPHLEPWRKFWKRVSDGRTGIWHETFLVRDGEYEAIYGNMPPRGLGKASRLVPVAESVGARQRLKTAAKGST
jgi:hypothetical protein